ncbi:MAG: HAD family hydrolase [Nocardioidaceae bacterium]
MLARCDSVAPSEFHRRVAAVVGDRAVPAYSGASGLAEISAAGVTKAAALASWCTDLGIDQGEVWAFGDMPNDLPMLAWAGRSYAVANAHPDVLAMADRRCGSNDDDGVAEVLEQLRR